MRKEGNDIRILSEAPIPAAVAGLAVPTVITQLINIFYNYADTWFVGRTGNPAAVAAMSVCMPLYVLMAAIANLFGIGGASVISRQLGMKNEKKARHVFAFCLYGGLAAALLYMAVMAFSGPKIIPYIGGDQNSYEFIRKYMFWTMVVGAVPTVGNVLCGHLVRSIGAAKEAGFGMSMGGVLNIFLDPLFMFVLLPPGNEVTGAACATCLSNTAALLYFVIYLVRHRNHPVFTVNVRDISFGDRIPAEVLLIGMPAAASTALAMVSNITANALVKDFGSEAVAGMGVAKKINMLAFNTAMGITQGVLPLIGYSYGAKKWDRLKGAVRYTAKLALAVTGACMVLFLMFAPSLTRFFIDEPGSVAYGTMFLRVVACASPLASVCYLVQTMFQASGRKTESFVLSILRKGVLDIPLMFVLRTVCGAVGVTLATPVAELLSTGVALLLVRNYWKTVFRDQN